MSWMAFWRATGLVLGLAACSAGASDPGQATAALRVGATVAPTCTVSVDEPGSSVERDPSVRVVCSRSGLRALRVTTHRGDSRRSQPATASFGVQRQAGGEVVFVVPVGLATVASNAAVLALPPLDRAPVTVTLDF